MSVNTLITLIITLLPAPHSLSLGEQCLETSNITNLAVLCLLTVIRHLSSVIRHSDILSKTDILNAARILRISQVARTE